ncbi:MAG: hypothetical protein KC766_23340 [Myxococcales bacterium]|nr:hypothetical protein [Myxococcales bacterium]
MTVDAVRSRRHASSDEASPEQTHKSEPSADDRQRLAESRQRAMSEGGATSPLASRAGGKDASVAAAQAYVRKTLAQNPDRAEQLLQQYHLKHQSPAVQQLVKRGIAGHAGKELYDRGCRLISALRAFSKEELGDIAGMVRAGTSLNEAIRQERAEKARPVHYEAPKSLAAQSRGPIARAKALANAVAGIRSHAGKTWSALPVITRDAELQLGLVKSTTAPIETFNAVADAAEDLSFAPLEKLGHEASVTKQYLGGAVTQLQAQTRSAYFTLNQTLENLGSAAKEYETAMSKSPPDVLSAQKAAARANAASKVLDAQVGRFYALAGRLDAANKEFDHQVPHVVKEVLISAAAMGLGLGLAAEASEAEIAARRAATTAEKAVHLAKHGLQELATDRALGMVVHEVEHGIEHIKRLVR